MRVKRLLARSPGAGLVRRFDPRASTEHAWELPPPLAGYRIYMGSEPERQYAHEYEPLVTAALARLVTSGFHCADVGANIGYTTLLLADLAGADGTVVAFEPLPENAERIRRNVALNGIGARVQVVEVAVADHEEAVDLHLAGSTFEASILQDRPRGSALSVAATTLDAYFANRRLDFVKIDIEGAERLAVRGMRNVLRTQKPTLVVELHGLEGARAVSELQNAGYVIEALDGEPVGAKSLPNHIVAYPSG